MKLALLAVFLALPFAMRAQTQITTGANSPILSNNSGDVSITDGPTHIKASQVVSALIAAKEDLQVSQPPYESAAKQAQTTINAKAKAVNDQILAMQAKLDADVRADKKYKRVFAKLSELGTQLNQVVQEGQSAFSKQWGESSNRIARDKTVIESLEKIVREQNNLPPSAPLDLPLLKAAK